MIDVGAVPLAKLRRISIVRCVDRVPIEAMSTLSRHEPIRKCARTSSSMTEISQPLAGTIRSHTIDGEVAVQRARSTCGV